MKITRNKKIAVFLLSLTMLFTGCSSQELKEAAIVDADGYSGIYFTNNSDKIKDPLEIPTGTTPSDTTDPDQTGDITTEDPLVTTPEETTPPDTATDITTVPDDTTSPEDTTSPDITTPGTTAETPHSGSLSAQDVELDSFAGNSYSTLNYDEVYGAWISYIELSAMLTGKSESSFRTNFGEAMDKCAELGINTVYVHVRPFGDAIYQSDYYPWSKYCAGSICEEPDFDPLTIMLEEAHDRNISFQAWINPMRTYNADDAKFVSEDYYTGDWIGNKSGDYISFSGSYWWLNPAYEDVRNLIANGVAEIVSNYDVDGIHIDDYFYPTTDASFDNISFEISGSSDLSAFRLSNTDKMVKSIYDAVKSVNSSCIFGVSPQGNLQNNYSYMYADVRKWCSTSGYIDYIAPQIYFGFKNDAQPYQTVLEQWKNIITKSNIKLIPGLCVSKIGEVDSVYAGTGANEWVNDSEIIARQIKAAEKMKRYGGFILYSYNYIFSDKQQVIDEMKAVHNIIS